MLTLPTHCRNYGLVMIRLTTPLYHRYPMDAINTTNNVVNIFSSSEAVGGGFFLCHPYVS